MLKNFSQIIFVLCLLGLHHKPSEETGGFCLGDDSNLEAESVFRRRSDGSDKNVGSKIIWEKVKV